MSLRRLAPGLAALLLCVPTGCAARPASTLEAHRPYQGTDLRGTYVLPDTTLIGVDGQPARVRTGRPVTVVFFGYTSCPDVCTGVLTDLAVALNRLPGQQRQRVAVLAVTTDPARDTGPVLRDYLRRIDPSFIGLTGTPEQLHALATAVGVDFDAGRTLPAGGYEVNHGAQLTAFGSDYRSLVVWTPGTSVGAMKHDLEGLVGR